VIVDMESKKTLSSYTEIIIRIGNLAFGIQDLYFHVPCVLHLVPSFLIPVFLVHEFSH
jgi:hypothetical protein